MVLQVPQLQNQMKKENVLNDPKKIDPKQNAEVNVSLNDDIQRPKTTQAWVPRKN